jgi:hypothetical protein
MSTEGAPEGRALALMNESVWTGSQLIVWGGLRFDTGLGFSPVYVPLTNGGVYDVASNTWTAIAAQGAPTHAPAEVFWTGTKLLVLGLLDGHTTPGELDFDGALFDPESNSWSPMSAPDASLASGFVWGDGNRKTLWVAQSLVILGERVTSTATPSVSFQALVYDPATDRWRGATLPQRPGPLAIPFDSKIVLSTSGLNLKDAAGADHLTTKLNLFDPETLALRELPLLSDRSNPGVVGSAHHLLVWGGKDVYTDLNAPDPCQNATGPCDSMTPTLTKLLGDGLALGL